MKILALLVFVAVLLAALLGTPSLFPGGADVTAVHPDEAATHPSASEELVPVLGEKATEASATSSEPQREQVTWREADPSPEDEPRRGDLLVYVVDEAGDPLGGVPLATHQITKSSRMAPLTAVTAEGSGLATFSGAAEALAERARFSPGSRFQVGLDVPGLDLQRVDVDLAEWPDKALRLIAPSSGVLKVRIVDVAGSPVSGRHWIHVTPLFEKPSHPGYLHRGERFSAQTEGASEVTFPVVQSGLKLRLGVQQHGRYSSAHEEIEALTPGERRTAKLVVDGPLPYVVGRVVLPSGDPVEARFLNVKSGPVLTSRVELEPDGSFRLVLSKKSFDHGARVTVRLMVQLPGADGAYGGGPTLTGEFDTAVPSVEAPADVGDVVMQEAPVFASGTVVDDAGHPVEGAQISIYTKFNQRADPENFGWSFAPVPYHRTDSKGRFQVAADLPPGEYAISARLKGYVVRSAVRFLSGQRDLLLHVSPQRFLNGRLLLPSGVNPDQCRIVANVPDATREERTYISFISGASTTGQFTITGLREPAVRLTLQYGEERQELATLDEILPTDSAEEFPSEINPWDLREELRYMAFDVLLADGAPATTGLVAYGSQVFAVEGGRVDALAKAEEDDEMLVVAPGHLPTILHAGALPKEVELLRGIPVRVAIETDLPALPEGAELTICLDRSSQDWLPSAIRDRRERRGRRLEARLWREELIVQAGETEWTLHVPAVGSYRPTWKVHHPAAPILRRGPRTKSFSSMSSRYEIEVKSTAGDPRRWSFQARHDHIKEAFRHSD